MWPQVFAILTFWSVRKNYVLGILFIYQSAGKNWFVNTNQLNALGGRMFKEWYERDCQGEQTAVVQSLNNDELEVLLKSCCAYTTPIVHRFVFNFFNLPVKS